MVSDAHSTLPTVHTHRVREVISESGAQILNKKSDSQSTGMVARTVILVEVPSHSYGALVVNTVHQTRSTTPVRTVTHAPLRSTTLGWERIRAGVAINTSTSSSDAMVRVG